MVAEEDDQRVVGDAGVLKPIQEHPDADIGARVAVVVGGALVADLGRVDAQKREGLDIVGRQWILGHPPDLVLKRAMGIHVVDHQEERVGRIGDERARRVSDAVDLARLLDFQRATHVKRQIRRRRDVELADDTRAVTRTLE